ncbi:hypothetical protein [Alloyangia pacifica]|uniref:3-carboxy-cis,cis-muconate cycloisomerase n=1 Tax=Alloyangia pacifica TaxID=311180 RepID=A0A1I6S1W2_9RHOB|nr:hypothetical protein [Alloyangia pacifica]SDG69148.1 3-carboxy-cis,cis-muconate cycloisomerase [Alloyangia pacifica]SFS70927.1 3-carboxy-cis,cis-muconate cycloisomerase [Alloyangia pacifica]
MSATPFDSAHLHRLFPAGDLAKLFSDSAEVRAIMIVAGTLAKVQGEAGLIPETAAKAIHRASLELQIDPGALAQGTAEAGSVVPPLLAAFTSLMQAPDYAQYLGQGALPEDLQDCALALRLRQVLTQLEARIDGIAADAELTALKAELPALRGALLCVSYEGQDAERLRPALAAALNLGDHGWGSERAPVTALADWAARLVRGLASRMPEQAPLAALATLTAALQATLARTSGTDAARRYVETLTLPQLLLATGAALTLAQKT